MPNVTRMPEWLNIRSGELRPLLLAMGAAFFMMSFMVLTRSLRESLFLATNDIENLPLIMGTVVIFSLPAVGQFSRLISRYGPRRILFFLTVALVFGQTVLWALMPTTSSVNVFYVWTAVGTLLLASGFWMVVAELFPLRGAKRLFSLISAGGTLGAMLTGVSISWLTQYMDLSWLVLLSVGPPVLFLLMVTLLPKPVTSTGSPDSTKEGKALLEAARTTWRSNHLRIMAGIIFTSTLVMTLIDFQFKAFAQNQFSSGRELAGFLGAFYGWAGLVSLLLQVFLSGWLVEKRGVAFSLSLPASLLLTGGVGLLFFPSFAVATSLRGLDYSLRKSLFRPTMEVLFVSVPTRLRRLTKAFIDTIVDSSAEGFGALVILLWLSVLKFPISRLSIMVVVFAAFYFGLSRRINRSYFQTIAGRLQEEESRIPKPGNEDFQGTGNLLEATFTNLDLIELQDQIPEPGAGSANGVSDEVENSSCEAELLVNLNSSDDKVVLRALAGIDTLNPDHLALMTRLMARDQIFRKVAKLLQRFPQQSVPPLVELLLSQKTDFVIRRRIPEILADMGGVEADDALLEVLTDSRFEVRYRTAVALLARRKKGRPISSSDWKLKVWHAVSLEVRKDRPLWELHRLLDSFDVPDDDLISVKVGVRGELSLEHTFRLLSLVLDQEQVRAAYHGVIFDDPELKSFALEYLEMVLPGSVKARLWFYIGDVSEKRIQRQARSMNRVVEDMMISGQTLFGGEMTRQALDHMVARQNPDQSPLKED
ncbi:MAG: MFS transporter [bacterium]|nr:MFS transporter [bacterium]